MFEVPGEEQAIWTDNLKIISIAGEPGYGDNNWSFFRLESRTSMEVSSEAGPHYWLRAYQEDEMPDWIAWYALYPTALQRGAIDKGDMEIRVTFDARNAKRPVWKDDLISFRMDFCKASGEIATARTLLGESSPELAFDGWNDQKGLSAPTTGWTSIEPGTNKIFLIFWSNYGEIDNNEAEVKNVRVHFRDKKGPGLKRIELTYPPVDTTVYKAGDEILVDFVFDERVKVLGDGTLGDIYTTMGGGTRAAHFVSWDGDRATYKFTVQEGDLAIPLRFVPPEPPKDGAPGPFANLTDVTGDQENNAYVGLSMGFTQNLGKAIIDGVPPKVKRVQISDDVPFDNNLKTGGEVFIDVHFDEPVLIDDADKPSLPLTNGGVAEYHSQPAIGGSEGPGGSAHSDIIRFKYVVDADSVETDLLDVVCETTGSGKALVMWGGQIGDLCGNVMTDLSVDDLALHMSPRNIHVDKTPPTIVITLPDDAGTTYKRRHSFTVQTDDPGDLASGLADEFAYQMGDVGVEFVAMPFLPPGETAATLGPAHGAAGISYTVENVAVQRNGDMYVRVTVADRAGNAATEIAGPLRYDWMYPFVTFAPDSSDTARVEVTIEEDEAGCYIPELGMEPQGGFMPDTIEYQWVDPGSEPSESSWSGIDSSTDVIKIWTQWFSLEEIPGETVRKSLCIRVSDIAGNALTARSPCLTAGGTPPQYQITNPAVTSGRSEYDITIYPWTGTTVQWHWTNDGLWHPELARPAPSAEETCVGTRAVQDSFTARDGEYFDGDWTLLLQAERDAGPVFYESYTFRFDNTAPQITIAPEPGHPVKPGAFAFTVTVLDDSPLQSPGTYYYWKEAVEGGAATDPVHFQDKVVTVNDLPPTDGPYNLIVFAQAGNISVAKSHYCIIDNTQPTAQIGVESPYPDSGRGLVLRVTGADNDIGLRYSYVLDGGTEWTDAGSVAGEIQADGTYKYTWPEKSVNIAALSEGRHVVWVKARDRAGNESPLVSMPFYVDRTAPTGRLELSTTTLTNQSVWVDAKDIADNVFPASDIKIMLDDKVVGSRFPVAENTAAEVILEDPCGNRTSLSLSIDWIDSMSPTVIVDPSPMPGVETKRLYVNASAYDRRPGYGDVFYDVDIWYAFTDSPVPPAGYDPSGSPEAPSGFDLPNRWLVPGECDSQTAWVSHVDYTADPAIWFEATGLSSQYYFHFKAVDSAGNEKVSTSGPFELKNVPPVPSGVTLSPERRTAGNVVATVSFEEPVAPVPHDFDPETFDGFLDYSETHQLTFTENVEGYPLKLIDQAWNVATVLISVGNIDPTVPSASVTYEPEGTWAREVTAAIDLRSAENPLVVYGFNLAGKDIEIAESGEVLVPEVEETCYSYIVLRFLQNADLEFTIRDLDTEVESGGIVQVANVDRTPPTAGVHYDPSTWTNKEVRAGLFGLTDSQSGGAVIVEGGAEHVFTENQTWDFVIEDALGNRATITATVNWIDRTPPSGEVKYWVDLAEGAQAYDPDTAWTNGNVRATLTPSDNLSGATITNNEGSPDYVFTDNGEFEFSLVDGAGNTAVVKAKVDKIDKVAPTATVIYSTVDPTKDDVTATLKALDDKTAVTVTNEEGVAFNELGDAVRLFTQNGTFLFEFRDDAGNTGAALAAVQNIFKDPPTAAVRKSTTLPTNKDVLVVVEPSPHAWVANNNGSNRVVFSKNGSFTFELKDLAGNTATVEVTVDNIDKTLPQGEIVVHKDNPSPGLVTAEFVPDASEFAPGASETWLVVANNSGKFTMTFRESGTAAFVVVDPAGNTRVFSTDIEGVDMTPPSLTVTYSTLEPTKGPVTATLSANETIVVENNGGSKQAVFVASGSFTFFVRDLAGNRASIRATVQNIDTAPPVLTFEQPLRLVYVQGSEYRLDDYSALDDRDGDLTDEVSVSLGGFDITCPGRYLIVYGVQDSLGNMTAITRDVTVISPDDMRLFINKEDPFLNTANAVISNVRHVKVTVLNALCDTTVRWKTGKLSLGQMKSGANYLPGDTFTVSATGWYTVVVQSQERESILAYVYVSSLSE